MAPPGGPLQAPGSSRSRQHRGNESVHESSGDFPMNQSGLGFIKHLCWAKGDWLLLNYLPSITFNKRFRPFQYLARALKLLMMSSFFWRQPPSSSAPWMMHSLTFISFLSLFPRHQTVLPSHFLYTAGPVALPIIHWDFLFFFPVLLSCFCFMEECTLICICNLMLA